MNTIVIIAKIIFSMIAVGVIGLLFAGTITGYLDFPWTIGMMVGTAVGAALGMFEKVVARWISASSETVAATLVRTSVGAFIGVVIGSLVGSVTMLLKTSVGLPRNTVIGLLGVIMGLVYWTAIKVAMSGIASAGASFVWSGKVVIGMLFGAIVGWIDGAVMRQTDRADVIFGTIVGAIVGIALGAIVGAGARKAQP